MCFSDICALSNIYKYLPPGTIAGEGMIGVARTRGLSRVAALAAIVSLAVAAGALAFALAAGASARTDLRQLSWRLVPAAGAAGALLAGYAAESGALRGYVTAGPGASITPLRDVVNQMPGYQARLAALVRGYPGLTGRLAGERAALAAWSARVAGPQLAATRRGDFAAALAEQNDLARNRPYVLAVRTQDAALQAQITSTQASVVARLAASQGRFLAALVVVCAIVVLAGAVAAVRRWLVRPFRTLRRPAESTAAGPTSIPVAGPAELAELSRAGEWMRARLAEAGQTEAGLRTVNAALEEQVRKHTAHLENTSKSLAALSYSVAHDLRTPLRAISGYAEILTAEYGDRLGETGRSYAGRIEAAGQHMDVVLDGLAQLSQVSQADLHPRDVDLSAEVTAICARLRVQDPGRRVRLTAEDGIRVTADPSLIRIALGRLLDNAWKYTVGCEDATIEVGTIPVTGPGVCCYVRDNGAGFDSAYADKLFQPFQQLQRTGEHGTGLAIVRRIIERHGGQTWADGAVGRGAVFYFTLGVHPTAASSAPAGLPPAREGNLQAGTVLPPPLESAVPSP
jgi:signal transduction histidine kinase